MPDLESRFRRWREELQSTLAFEPEEIAELEDHLREAVDTHVQKGVSIEQAWTESVRQLGETPSLALEFAKRKVLPSLFKLFQSWWRPLLLAFLSGLVTYLAIDDQLWLALGTFLISVIAVAAMPHKRSLRNGLLLGVGISFCMVLPLESLLYNPFTARFLWKEWALLGPPVPVWMLAVSSAAVIGLGLWGWFRTNTRIVLPLAMVLVFILALSPAISTGAGHFSMRGIWKLPSSEQASLTDEERTQFTVQTEIRILFEQVSSAAVTVPLVLIIAGSLGAWMLVSISKRKRQVPPVFPMSTDRVWLVLLAVSGCSWITAAFVEPPFSATIRDVASRVSASNTFNGMELVLIAAALLYGIAAAKCGRGMQCARRISPFYVGSLVAGESAVGLILLWLAQLWREIPRPEPIGSALPWTAQTILISSVLFLAIWHGFIVWRKIRSGAVAPSRLKSTSTHLLESGAAAGVILALAGLLLFMTAMILAYESVYCIQLWQEWGRTMTSNLNPEDLRFDPNHYIQLLSEKRAATWLICGVAYLSGCLTVGWGSVIFLSGLEFVRWNGYRLFKAWRVSGRQNVTNCRGISTGTEIAKR